METEPSAQSLSQKQKQYRLYSRLSSWLDIEALQSIPLSLDFFTLFQKFCQDCRFTKGLIKFQDNVFGRLHL